MATKMVRDLVPGDRFITPGGNTLTVERVQIGWQSGDAYDVITREPYGPGGECFNADGDYVVEIALTDQAIHPVVVSAADRDVSRIIDASTYDGVPIEVGIKLGATARTYFAPGWQCFADDGMYRAWRVANASAARRIEFAEMRGAC